MENHPYASIEGWPIEKCELESLALYEGNVASDETARKVRGYVVGLDHGTTVDWVRSFEEITGLWKGEIRQSSGEPGNANLHVIYWVKTPIDRRWFADYKEESKQLAGLYSTGIPNPGVDREMAGKVHIYLRKGDKGLRNLKYKDNNEQALLCGGEVGSRERMREVLKSLNFQIPEHQTYKDEIKKIRAKLKSDGCIIGTHEQCAEKLGIPLRSYQEILSKLEEWKEIKVEYKGNNRPGNPRYSVITSLIYKSKFFDTSEMQYKKTKNQKPNRGEGFLLEDREVKSVLNKFSGKIIKSGERNSTAFRLVRALRHRYGGKINENSHTAVLEALKKSIVFEDFGRSFTEKELKAVIKSALNARYDRPASRPACGSLP